MPLPGNGWLPTPLNTEITQFLLPEPFKVEYYVCTPGPYDPLQPYEKPVIEFITINQMPTADSGWKNGSWGWVARIDWPFAYGDALIDAVWPPLEPTTVDDTCPGNDDVTDDLCPPMTKLTPEETPPDTVLVNDAARAVPTVVIEARTQVAETQETSATMTFVDENCPGSHTGQGCE